MTPPPSIQHSMNGSEVHAKFFGQEIDLKGKAAKSAPLAFAILSLIFCGYLAWHMDSLDKKVDKILFILAGE